MANAPVAAKAPVPPGDDEDDDEVLADKAREVDLEGGRMPFMSHLKELRDRVFYAACFFMLAFVICWWFAGDIYAWLREPLFHVWRAHADKLGPPTMAFAHLTEPFWVDMSVGLWAGIFLSSPFIFNQIWRFIAPGLYKRERRVGITFAVFSAIFFVGGALFCYYLVLGNLYDFLLSYGSKDLHPILMIDDYLELTRNMMLAFGVVFELPLLIYFLAMVGLVTHRGLWKFNRWFIVLAFIIGAILTPSPDVVSQIMMATPMIVLYNLSILGALQVTRKREAKAAALAAKEAAAEAKRRAARAAEAADDDDDEYEDDDDEYEDDE